MGISDSFRRARQRARLTQATVARELGVHQTTVSGWECGVALPALGELPRIARLYKTTVRALVAPFDRQEDPAQGAA